MTYILDFIKSVADIMCSEPQLKSEAASRMIIDQFLLATVAASLDAGLKKAIRIFPELTITTPSDKCWVEYDGFQTLLTGSTDYGVHHGEARLDWYLFEKGRPSTMI